MTAIWAIEVGEGCRYNSKSQYPVFAEVIVRIYK